MTDVDQAARSARERACEQWRSVSASTVHRQAGLFPDAMVNPRAAGILAAAEITAARYQVVCLDRKPCPKAIATEWLLRCHIAVNQKGPCRDCARKDFDVHALRSGHLLLLPCIIQKITTLLLSLRERAPTQHVRRSYRGLPRPVQETRSERLRIRWPSPTPRACLAPPISCHCPPAHRADLDHRRAGRAGSAARTGSAGLPDTGSAHPAPRRCLGRPPGRWRDFGKARRDLYKTQRPQLPSGGRAPFVLYYSHERRRAGRARFLRQQEESASICASGVPSYAADHESHTCVTTLVAFAGLAVDGATG